jgi:hypothetical protein
MASSLHRLANKPHPCELQPEPINTEPVNQVEANFEVSSTLDENSLIESEIIVFEEELTAAIEKTVENATSSDDALKQTDILSEVITTPVVELQTKAETTKTSKTKKKVN